MDIIGNLAHGFGVALSFTNLLFALIGALIGTAIGVLPGIGPVATISLLLPITFGQPATTAIIMLAGIYYGAQYGGSTTAILLNLPGEISSVVTTLEGYKMARNGRAGAALAIAALASFFAGTVATVVVAGSGPLLTRVALSFGPAEYFSLMVLGLIISAVLAQGSVVKAIGMVVLGVVMGLVGTDVQTGQQRFTFGMPELSDGIGFVALAMGMFGIAEIILNLERPEARSVLKTKVGSLMTDARRNRLRATPRRCAAPCSAPSSASCRAAARRCPPSPPTCWRARSRRTGTLFGTGAIEGVAGPEAANNAAAQTTFIPMLTLGIPSNAVMALMVGAMIIQGIQPGPAWWSPSPTCSGA